ncbi:MAG TPA: hypothetical protein VK610_01370 [Rhodothermales bacterium]|nr:hypothetical protein [Rhodothermales bacterium]
MIERDFILRQVAQLVQALAAVLFRKKAGETVAAQQLLDDTLTDATGLPLMHLRHLDFRELLDLCLSPGGEFSSERAVALADLLREDADVHGREQANRLYTAARNAGGTVPWRAMSDE